jgi:hypothetical protein
MRQGEASDMTAKTRGIEEHDVVRFVAQVDRWPAGTEGTVVAMHPEALMVEISDDDGCALDFVWAADALLEVTWYQGVRAAV